MLNSSRRFFFLLVSIYVLIMQFVLLYLDKGEEIKYLCVQRTGMLTDVFKLITHLGEWVPIVALGLFLLLQNKKVFLCALASFLPLDLIMILIKNALEMPRPLSYFPKGEIIPIENFEPLYHNSMPSGHTFTAFFVATFICFFYSLNKSWQLIIFSLAILVGISRMYLMCHFVEDVFAGSILGIIAGILPAFIYNKWIQTR